MRGWRYTLMIGLKPASPPLCTSRRNTGPSDHADFKDRCFTKPLKDAEISSIRRNTPIVKGWVGGDQSGWLGLEQGTLDRGVGRGQGGYSRVTTHLTRLGLPWF